MSLERVDSVWDLGVEISSGFVWNDHVNKIVGKCNKMMGLIKRTIGYEAPIRVSKTLYSTLIRSNLEYCSSVWNGTSKRNISLIEGVQRRATKFILHYPEEDYKSRLDRLDILPLSFRREITDLIYFCNRKITHLNIDRYISFNVTQGRPTTRLSSDPYCS